MGTIHGSRLATCEYCEASHFPGHSTADNANLRILEGLMLPDKRTLN
jgi:hypothetical protein